MKDVLGLSTTTTTSTADSTTSFGQEKMNIRGTLDPESQTPIHVDNSLMERLMPFQFEFTTGAVMIGNMELRSMMVIKLSQASGIYSITKARSSMDYYKSVFDFVIRKPQISLKDNMDFTNVDENAERVIKPQQKTT